MNKLFVVATTISVLAASGVASANCESGRYQGLYAGANGGFVSHNSTWTDEDLWVDNFSVDFALGSVERTEMGLTGGVQGGYNWQQECAVLGIEMDLNGTTLDESDNYTANAGPGTTATLENQVNWFSTIRGRAGVVVDGLMLYVTGGLAYGDIDQTWTVNDNGIPTTEQFSSDGGVFGFAGGAGAEWSVSSNMSIRAEWIYVDFENQSTSGFSPAGAQSVSFDTKDSLSTGRVGVNIKF